MKDFNHTAESQSATGEDIKYIIFKYLRFWPWFVFSVILFVVGAFFYLKFSTPIYSTSAEVKVLKEDEGGVDLSGLSNSTTLFNYNKVNLENEMQIFKSRRMLRQVIAHLGLTTSIYRTSSFGDELLFGEQIPFEVDWLEITHKDIGGIQFSFTFKSDSLVTVYNEEKDIEFSVKVEDTVRKFSNSFSIRKKPSVTIDPEVTYQVHYNTIENLLARLSRVLGVAQIGDKSDILSLTIHGSNTSRNEAVINTLINLFNQDGVEDRRLVSKRTQEFVEERLELLVRDLDTVETGLVDFKKDNDIVNVESSVGELFTKEATSESEKFTMETQLVLAKDFQDLLVHQSDYELLPANLGINSTSVNDLTVQYNSLVIERNRLLISSTTENPIILKLNNELSQIKANILQSLRSYVQSLELSLARLSSRKNQYAGEISNLPQKEKELKVILRQQAIKERLYLFLLQKREEAALSYAITSPSLKIVDYAYTSGAPISPKKQMFFLAAIVLGLLIPAGVLYIYFLLKTTVEHRQDVEHGLKDIAILGEVPQISKSVSKVIHENDSSVLAEAFRILKTNLLFSIKRNQISREQGVVVFVTSSIKGEGKTFTAVNLSKILASSKKRVLLIGSDLRNPQIHQYFSHDSKDFGLSEFLYGEDGPDGYQKYVQKHLGEFTDVEVMFSGSVPPNPAELLSNGKFEQLLSYLKSVYDYIIVDTAPTVYVTDTFLIADQADTTVYLVKQNVTEKKLLEHINEASTSHKLQGVNVVFNGVDTGTNLGYGYGYAYDNKVKHARWKFWKS